MVVLSNVFYDTDCFSCFVWVKREDIIFNIWNVVHISEMVYEELMSPLVPQIGKRIQYLKKTGKIIVDKLKLSGEEIDIYRHLTDKENTKVIGKGEASTIALVHCRGGIMASNNLKDISTHIKRYNIKNITTMDILYESYKRGYITKETGDSLYTSMINKKRKIGNLNLSEYIKSKEKL